MTEAVTVYKRVADAEDEYGDPAERWEPNVVDGCLVYELAGSDLADADRPDGSRVEARVNFPDEWASALPRGWLKGCKVALTDRGQTEENAYRVIGNPNHQELPTRWSTTVEVGRTDG